MPKFIKKKKVVVTSVENVLEFTGLEVLEALRQSSDEIPSSEKHTFVNVRLEVPATCHAGEFLDIEDLIFQVVWNERLENEK